jgi:enamine deaminase RidA (YjgF/YER057c/UK114 family)
MDELPPQGDGNEARETLLDEELDETFPASDPTSGASVLPVHGRQRSGGRRRITSGSPYERSVGFSRALVVDRDVHVSATAPIMADGSDPPTDTYGQTRRAIEIVMEALAEAGAGPQHVVRTRIYLAPAADPQEAGRAHQEVFGEVRPASTLIVVHGFVDPRWLLEIEAHALLD